MRHGDGVGDRAISQPRDRPLLDEPLTLEGAQIVAEATGITSVAFEIVGEDRPEARRTLQEIHLRAAKLIDPRLVSHRFAVPP